MPTKWSFLYLISYMSNIQTLTLTRTSKAKFYLFQYYTLAGLHLIRSSNFRSACLPENPYWRFPRGARKLNNGYYALKLKNMWWQFQHSTQIWMVGLSVLTGSSWLSNRLTYCIMHMLQLCWTDTFRARECCIKFNWYCMASKSSCGFRYLMNCMFSYNVWIWI